MRRGSNPLEDNLKKKIGEGGHIASLDHALDPTLLSRLGVRGGDSLFGTHFFVKSAKRREHFNIER